MLILTRKIGEEIVVNDNISITISKVVDGEAFFEINGPESISITTKGKVPFDDDASKVAKIAKEATLKASAKAKKLGYWVERKGNICIAHSPTGDVVFKENSKKIDMKKIYTFKNG